MFSIILSFLVLSIIFYQDIKYRAVWWFLFPTLFLVGLFSIDFNYLVKDYILNIVYVTTLLIVIWLYSWFKFKNINIKNTNSLIGLGDVLFFFSVTPLFKFIVFNIYFVTALIFSLIIHFISQNKNWYNGKTVPLAGLMSLYTIFFHLLYLKWRVI